MPSPSDVSGSSGSSSCAESVLPAGSSSHSSGARICVTKDVPSAPERLSTSVTPLISFDPALVTVRVTVPPSCSPLSLSAALPDAERAGMASVRVWAGSRRQV